MGVYIAGQLYGEGKKSKARALRALHPINQILSPFLIQISAADDGESFVRIIDYYQLLSDGCRCR